MERLSKVNWNLNAEYGKINIVIELIFKYFRSEGFEFCKPGWFVLSQTMLGIGNYAIMCSLFRLRFHRHIIIISVISFLTSVINYSIYFNKQHDGLGYLVPIIGMVISFLYLAAVKRSL